MYDFDALFDLRFKNRLCCEYVLVHEMPILSTQTIFGANRLMILAKDHSRVWEKRFGE